MDLHQVRYFLAVAEAGSFTEAARRCFISQPSLSQQILNLEAELGQKLFNRLGRRNLLTAAGERFLIHAQRLQLEADEAIRAVRENPAKPAGRVLIGAIPTVGPYLMPQLMDRCRSLLPDVRIETLEDFATRLLEELVAGELDFALVARTIPDSRLVAEPLFEEPLLLIVASGHRLAVKEEILPADLAGEELILLGERSSLTAQIGRFLGDGAIEPRIAHRCAQVETVKAMVASGLGVAILPQIVREPRSDAKRRLVYRTLSTQPANRTISLVRRKARYQSQAALAVTRTLRELL